MMREASRKLRETTLFTPPLLREASRKVVSKNSCGSSQICILSNPLPVFAKNASYINSS